MTPELKEWLIQLLQAVQVIAEGGPNAPMQVKAMLDYLRQELETPENWPNTQ
jgi:hypothetical protein